MLGIASSIADAQSRAKTSHPLCRMAILHAISALGEASAPFVPLTSPDFHLQGIRLPCRWEFQRATSIVVKDPTL